MKKRILSALLMLALCLPALGALAAGANTSDIYHLAINDHFFDSELNAATMPVKANGVIYVPYTVFDRDIAQADFKISYGQKREGGEHTLTLYSINGALIFDLVRGTTTDVYGNSVGMRAILHNGRPFIPIQAVCNYFNTLAGTTLVQYVYTDTEYGALIRLRNEDYSLSDFMFRQSALSYMQYRLNRYLQGQSPQPSTPVQSTTAPAAPNPTVTPRPDEDEDEPNRHETPVYLAFRCQSGEGLAEILDTLTQEGVVALFLFSPERLEQQADQVRQVVGSGQRLGLLVSGGSGKEALAELEQGNALLEEVAWTRTRTVLADGAGSQVIQALEEAGWYCWQGNVDGLTGTGAVSRADQIYTAVEQAGQLARITMDDSNLSSAALSRLLSRLREEGHEVRAAVETELD